MNIFKLMLRTSAAVALALVFLGCSKSSDTAVKFNPTTGQHPANWIDQHWLEFTANPMSCVTCHGSYKDAATSGGVSGVTCFQCHHKNGPTHPSNWALLTQHGKLGAIAAPGLSTGMTHCSACHGSDYRDASAKTMSCFACHTKAPHPDKPWHGTTASGTNHAAADQGNAAACIQCHANGANCTSITFRGTPAPAGSAPGCYNNTMCHGNNPGHVVGWSDPAVHGRTFAQAAPGANTGFAYCATCHGSTYKNGTAPSCLSCHTRAPHPNKPWTSITTTGVNHTLTNQGNAPECFKCHAAGNNSSMKPSATPPAGSAPGCLNNTMCHSTRIN
jgi:hypothetical protein